MVNKQLKLKQIIQEEVLNINEIDKIAMEISSDISEEVQMIMSSKNLNESDHLYVIERLKIFFPVYLEKLQHNIVRQN